MSVCAKCACIREGSVYFSVVSNPHNNPSPHFHPPHLGERGISPHPTGSDPGLLPPKPDLNGDAATPQSNEPARAQLLLPAIGRGTALFMGIISVVQVLLHQRHPTFDTNVWWIDLYLLNIPMLIDVVLMFFGMLWIGFALRPNMSDWRRRLTRTGIELLFLFVAWSILNFYFAYFKKTLHSPVKVPAALFFGFALALIYLGLRPEKQRNDVGSWLIMALALSGMAILFPVSQMICVGMADGTRRPDNIKIPILTPAESYLASPDLLPNYNKWLKKNLLGYSDYIGTARNYCETKPNAKNQADRIASDAMMRELEVRIGIPENRKEEFRNSIVKKFDDEKVVNPAWVGKNINSPEFAEHWRVALKNDAMNYRDADVVVLLGSETDQQPITEAAMNLRIAQAVKIFEYSQCDRIIIVAPGNLAANTGEIANLSAKLLAYKDPETGASVTIDKLIQAGTGTEADATGDRMYSALSSQLQGYHKDNPDHHPIVILVSEFYNLPRLRMRLQQESQFLFGSATNTRISPYTKNMISEVKPYWKSFFQGILN